MFYDRNGRNTFSHTQFNAAARRVCLCGGCPCARVRYRLRFGYCVLKLNFFFLGWCWLQLRLRQNRETELRISCVASHSTNVERVRSLIMNIKNHRNAAWSNFEKTIPSPPVYDSSTSHESGLAGERHSHARSNGTHTIGNGRMSSYGRPQRSPGCRPK